MNIFKRLINSIKVAKVISEVQDYEKTLAARSLKMRLERIKILQQTNPQACARERAAAAEIVKESYLSEQAKDYLLKMIAEYE